MSVSSQVAYQKIIEWSHDSRERFVHGNLEDKARAVGYAVGARAIAFASAIYEVSNTIRYRMLSHSFKVIHVLVDGRCSADACVRVAAHTTIFVTLFCLRTSLFFASVVSPEIFLEALQLHRPMFKLGLINKALFLTYDFLPPAVRDRVPRGTFSFSFRGKIVELAMAEFERRQGEPIDQIFGAVWANAIERAMDAQLQEGVEVVRPVHVRNGFFVQYLHNIHDVAVKLFQDEVFSQEEIQDMSTAYEAILNNALFRLVDEKITLGSYEVNYEEDALLDRLATHSEEFINAKRAIEALDDREKEDMFRHLCCDNERFDTPWVEATARQKECKNRMVALRTRVDTCFQGQISTVEFSKALEI